MKRSALARNLDNLVICLVLMLLFFALARTFISSLVLSIAIALFFSGFITYLIIAKQNARYEKLSIEKAELKEIDQTIFVFRQMPLDKKLDFFEKMLKTRCIERKEKTLIIDHSVLLCISNKDILQEEDIFSCLSLCYNLPKISEINIVCNKVDPKAEKLAHQTNKTIIFLTGLEVYALMKKYNCFLSEKKVEKMPKKRAVWLGNVFLKSQGKNLIKIGILLYIMAFFLPFTKYYIICASLTLSFGLIFLIFGKAQITTVQTSTLIKENH